MLNGTGDFFNLIMKQAFHNLSLPTMHVLLHCNTCYLIKIQFLGFNISWGIIYIYFEAYEKYLAGQPPSGYAVKYHLVLETVTFTLLILFDNKVSKFVISSLLNIILECFQKSLLGKYLRTEGWFLILTIDIDNILFCFQFKINSFHLLLVFRKRGKLVFDKYLMKDHESAY